MSSIPEKSSVTTTTTTVSIVEKRSFFLRTSSIQKIKCSATYPFRLAGTKFSKDSIKQLFETLISDARILSQKAFIDLLIATFNLVGILLSLWVGAPAKDVCDNTKKTESVLGFHERLLEKIRKLQKHKQRFELKAKDLSSSSSSSSSSSTPIGKGNSLCSKSLRLDRNNSKLQFEFGKLGKCIADKSKNDTNSLSDTKSINVTDNIYNPKKDYLLVMLVYSSAIFIYLQLLILAVALNTTQHLPPGLLFLITSLILIAVIVFKVFLVEKQDKCETRKQIEKQGSKTTEETESSSSSSSLNNNTRQTRLKVRKIPMIDFNSKTISKIKIL